MALVCVLEQYQGFDLMVEKKSATLNEDDARTTTEEVVRLDVVRDVSNDVGNHRSWVFIVLLVIYANLMIAEWVLAFFSSTFLIFTLSSMVGTLFFMGFWFCVSFTTALYTDKYHLGYEVSTYDGLSITLTGGFFFRGLLGVMVCVKEPKVVP